MDINFKNFENTFNESTESITICTRDDSSVFIQLENINHLSGEKKIAFYNINKNQLSQFINALKFVNLNCESKNT